jgi:hypothetical protein
VWSTGGGVDSTAIAVLIENGLIEKPDISFMVDTGYEKTSTWEYMNNVTMPRLKSVGVTIEIVKTTDWSSNNIFNDAGYIVIPIFKRVENRTVKLKTHCNNTWKAQVSERYLRSKGVKRAEIWMGIAADETKRQRESRKMWLTYRYPLIEKRMTRKDCLALIKYFRWPDPHKTSCVMCGLQDRRVREAMREEYPQEWQRAIEIERERQSREPCA